MEMICRKTKDAIGLVEANAATEKAELASGHGREKPGGGEQEKVDRVRSFVRRRLTDAGAVKNIGSIRKVSSGDRSLQEDRNRRHRGAVVVQCTHETRS